jgi:hypothetical protein
MPVTAHSSYSYDRDSKQALCALCFSVIVAMTNLLGVLAFFRVDSQLLVTMRISFFLAVFINTLLFVSFSAKDPSPGIDGTLYHHSSRVALAEDVTQVQSESNVHSNSAAPFGLSEVQRLTVGAGYLQTILSIVAFQLFCANNARTMIQLGCVSEVKSMSKDGVTVLLRKAE